jgi:hypothetical protein
MKKWKKTKASLKTGSVQLQLHNQKDTPDRARASAATPYKKKN